MRPALATLLLLLPFACAHPTSELADEDDYTPSTPKAGSTGHGGSGGAKPMPSAGTGGKTGIGHQAPPGDGGASESDGGEPAGAENGGQPAVVAPGPGPSTPPGELSLHYQAGNTALNDNQIDPHFRVVSSSAAPVELSQLSARYYFTSELAPPLSIEIYNAAATGTSGYRALQSGSVLATAEEGYVELTFSDAAGVLDAGGQVTIEIAIHDAGWSGLFDETDDYSFNAAHTDYAAWDHVTLYDGGTLVSGIEPE